MAEESKFAWVKRSEPKPEIYTNFVHTSWTLFDVRFQLGLLIPSEPGISNKFVIEHQGAVTITWAEAKFLRDVLNGLVESYEKTNGEIKTLKLTPSPEFEEEPGEAGSKE